MTWKDILKNDDCLRWMNKLYQIMAKYPDSSGDSILNYTPKEIVNEKEACRVKKNWQETHLTNSPVRRQPHLMGVSMPHVGYRNFKTGREDERVDFTVSNLKYKGSNMSMEFWLSLSAYIEGKRHVVTLYTDDKETVLKIIKEVCNYLNLDDTPMIEHAKLEMVSG